MAKKGKKVLKVDKGTIRKIIEESTNFSSINMLAEKFKKRASRANIYNIMSYYNTSAISGTMSVRLVRLVDEVIADLGSEGNERPKEEVRRRNSLSYDIVAEVIDLYKGGKIGVEIGEKMGKKLGLATIFKIIAEWRNPGSKSASMSIRENVERYRKTTMTGKKAEIMKEALKKLPKNMRDSKKAEGSSINEGLLKVAKTIETKHKPFLGEEINPNFLVHLLETSTATRIKEFMLDTRIPNSYNKESVAYIYDTLRGKEANPLSKKLIEMLKASSNRSRICNTVMISLGRAIKLEEVKKADCQKDEERKTVHTFKTDEVVVKATFKNQPPPVQKIEEFEYKTSVNTNFMEETAEDLSNVCLSKEIWELNPYKEEILNVLGDQILGLMVNLSNGNLFSSNYEANLIKFMWDNNPYKSEVIAKFSKEISAIMIVAMKKDKEKLEVLEKLRDKVNLAGEGLDKLDVFQKGI